MGEKAEFSDDFWRRDEEGWYLPTKTKFGEIEIRPSNSFIFRHKPPFEPIDHVFIILNVDEESGKGEVVHVWRDRVDFFDELTDSMIQKGFELFPRDEPYPEDLEYYEEYTGKKFETFDALVELSMSHLEQEWDYLQDEDGWHP